LSLRVILTSLIPAGSLSETSFKSGLFSNSYFNSSFAAFSSSILLPRRETATGLPPKLPPEPKTKLSTP